MLSTTAGGPLCRMLSSTGRERMQPPILSEEDRSRILDDHIRTYVGKRYRVVSRTPTAAQLVRPKKFSWLWAFCWFLLLGVGVLVYVLYFAVKSDRQLYLEVDEWGQVRAR
jgi:hypothetical protein